mmetsp:Transcript_29826/g.71028  ORF Transcript_29826/g.71028 Transcript_29826/m.71028 type:complete len:238 (-) Transcript_29826:2-715(-)
MTIMSTLTRAGRPVHDLVAFVPHFIPVDLHHRRVRTDRLRAEGVQASETCVLGLVIVEDLSLDHAVNAIGGDHQISGACHSVLESQDDTVSVLSDLGKLVAQLEGIRRHAVNEHALQIRAHGNAHTLRGIEVRGGHHLAVEEELHLFRRIRLRLEHIPKAQPPQDLRSLGHLERATAGLPRLPSLVDLNLDVAWALRENRLSKDQATKPSTDHRNLQGLHRRVRHGGEERGWPKNCG